MSQVKTYFSRKNKNLGFTMIMVIVSILVSSIFLTASLKLIVSGATLNQNSRLQTKAVYLAEQCAEISRNLRDSAWKQHLKWDCPFRAQLDNQCQNLQQKFASLSSPIDNFTRKTTTELNSTQDLISITCSVSWHSNRTVSIFFQLSNWKQQ